jgi:hypothetical protein
LSELSGSVSRELVAVEALKTVQESRGKGIFAAESRYVKIGEAIASWKY